MNRDPFWYVLRLYFAFVLLALMYQAVLSMVRELGAAIADAGDSTSNQLHTAPSAGAHLVTALLGTALVLGIAFAVHVGLFRWARQWYHAHIRPPRPAAHGAHFATERELRRARLLGTAGWPIGVMRGQWLRVVRRVVRLSPDRERAGVLAFAPPGSGKSSGLVIPAILSEVCRAADDRRSLVIGDPKDELARLTLGALKTSHRTWVWDPSSPAACTVTFDPLLTLPSPESYHFVAEVRDLADTWSSATRQSDATEHSTIGPTDPYWQNQARALMRAVFFTYLDAYPDGSFIHLADWVRGLDFEEFARAVEGSASAHVRDYASQVAALGRNDKGTGSVWSDVLERFEVCKDSRLRTAMGPGPSIDWAAFVEEPTALYLRVSIGESARLQALLSLFLARMYSAFTRLALDSAGNRLPREVRVIIDEAGNLPRIQGLETSLATFRSYGVGHYLVIQSSSQLRQHYGDEGAQLIMDCLVTKLCLGGAADQDAKWFSARCGNRTTYYANPTYSGSGLFRQGRVSYGHGAHTEPLISPAEIIHLSGKVLMSTAGVPPLLAELRPYFQDRTMQDLVDVAPPLTVAEPAYEPPWPA